MTTPQQPQGFTIGAHNADPCPGGGWLYPRQTQKEKDTTARILAERKQQELQDAQDTYAAYAARPQAEKQAAKRARQVEKVWRAHLKRQAKWDEALAVVSKFSPRKKAAFFLDLLPHTTLNKGSGKELWETLEIRKLIKQANQKQPLP